jgi:hypothetical protein
MRYYITTTTKFANECIKYGTYGATQSNWLANIEENDVIFLSQFDYKSQCLFGPFRVTKRPFYNKDIIYPLQKYFYRIQFGPLSGKTRVIEETDLYLYAIQSNYISEYFGLINLIQQNKHLHCISLNNFEGEAIFNAFSKFGVDYPSDQNAKLTEISTEIDCEYIWQKNKLDKKHYFSSESDLEAYLMLAFKNTKSEECKTINKLLTEHENNQLHSSYIYNQFIFGNAYPSDIAIINDANINVFELKKDGLSNALILQIEKEMKKHLYYSLFSNRLQPKDIKRFNFYLVYLSHEDNSKFRQLILERYNNLCKKINTTRKNTITLVEYKIRGNSVLFQKV